jgi:hypothetical protein
MKTIVDDYNRLMESCRANVENRRGAIRRRWEEKRWSAAAWRDYQLECAQRLFEAEVEAVEKEFEEERARLKEKLICELLEERKRLMDELEPTLATSFPANVTGTATNPPGNVVSGKRSLRKRNAPEDSSSTAMMNAPNQGLIAQGNLSSINSLKTLSGKEGQSRRRTPASPFDQLGRMGIETRLAEEDIYDDLNTMYREDTRSGRRTAPRAASKMERDAEGAPGHAANGQQLLQPVQSSNTTPQQQLAARTNPQRISGPKGPTAVVSASGDTLIDAYVSDSALHYQNSRHVFAKGDPISVLVTQSDSVFTGTVSTVGANELWIRREDGTKNKIYLGQLRIGKYKVAPPGAPFEQ